MKSRSSAPVRSWVPRNRFTTNLRPEVGCASAIWDRCRPMPSASTTATTNGMDEPAAERRAGHSTNRANWYSIAAFTRSSRRSPRTGVDAKPAAPHASSDVTQSRATGRRTRELTRVMLFRSRKWGMRWTSEGASHPGVDAGRSPTRRSSATGGKSKRDAIRRGRHPAIWRGVGRAVCGLRAGLGGRVRKAHTRRRARPEGPMPPTSRRRLAAPRR